MHSYTKLFLIMLNFSLGAVFLAAGLSKLLNFSDYVEYISYMAFLPIWAKMTLCVAVPAVEVSAGTNLVLHPTSKSFDFLITSVFLLFLIFQIVDSLPSMQISPKSCPCFSGLDESSDHMWLVMRNLCFVALAALRIFLKRACAVKSLSETHAN